VLIDGLRAKTKLENYEKKTKTQVYFSEKSNGKFLSVKIK